MKSKKDENYVRMIFYPAVTTILPEFTTPVAWNTTPAKVVALMITTAVAINVNDVWEVVELVDTFQKY